MLQKSIANKNLLRIVRQFSTKPTPNQNPNSYIPPKPKEFRKVVREKDTYARGYYEISPSGMKVLQEGPQS